MIKSAIRIRSVPFIVILHLAKSYLAIVMFSRILDAVVFICIKLTAIIWREYGVNVDFSP